MSVRAQVKRWALAAVAVFAGLLMTPNAHAQIVNVKPSYGSFFTEMLRQARDEARQRQQMDREWAERKAHAELIDSMMQAARQNGWNADLSGIVAREIQRQREGSPARYYKFSTNPSGLNIQVPHGVYSGENILGEWEQHEIVWSGETATDYARGGGYMAGYPGRVQAAGGWNFEPIQLLTKTWFVRDAWVSTELVQPPTPQRTTYYRTHCSVQVRYSYGTAQGEIEFLPEDESGSTCNYVVTEIASEGAQVGVGYQACIGGGNSVFFEQCLPNPGYSRGRYWSTTGQMELRTENPDKELRMPDGSGIVFTKSNGIGDLDDGSHPSPFVLNREAFGGSGEFYNGAEYRERIWFPTSMADSNGNTTRYVYDGNNRFVERVIAPNGKTTRYVRDAAGTILEIHEEGIGGLDQVHRLTWDSWHFSPAANNVDFAIGCENPCDPTTYSCNCVLMVNGVPSGVCGDPWAESIPGATRVYWCPWASTVSVHTLERLEQPDGTAYEFKYGAWGNLTEVKTPSGAVTAYEYDRRAPSFPPAGWENVPGSLHARRVTAMTVYPEGLGGPGHTTRYEQRDVADFPPGRQTCQAIGDCSCVAIQWSSTIFPDGHVVREGRCAYAVSGDIPGSSYPIALETWVGGTLQEATYYGNMGIENDGVWPGVLYQVYGGGGPWFFRVVHVKDGIRWTEELDYELYDTPMKTRRVSNQPCAPDSQLKGARCTPFHTTGNILRQRLFAAGSLLQEKQTSYFHTPEYFDRNLIRLVSSEQLFDAGSALVSRIDYRYDEFALSGSNVPGEFLDRSMGNVRGNVTSVVNFTDPASGQGALTTTSTYYETGTANVVRDARGAPTTSTHDFTPCSPGSTTRVSTEVNALQHTTTRVTDCYTGATLSVTDPNLQRACTQYDRFGRVVASAGPGDSVATDAGLITAPGCSGGEGGPTNRVEYPPLGTAPRWTVTRTKDGTSDGLVSKTFVDGLGRKIQTCTETDAELDGHGWVCDFTAYDSMGRAWQTFVSFYADNVGMTPVPVPPGTPYTKTLYDGLGRITSSELIGVTGQSFGRTETSYGTAQYTALDGGAATGFATTVTDPNGHWKKSITNLLGHGVETRAQWRGCPEDFCTTKMKPDGLGRVIKIQDPNGNVTTVVYDGLGRKLELRDPDMGSWRYRYDENGNLTEQIDAKGQVIRMQYDALNRLTLQDLPPTGPDEDDVVSMYDGNVLSSCYSCEDHCPTTTDTCDPATKTCTHVGQPCPVPCIPRTCANVTCGTSVPDGCGGTLSCCNGSGCTPVSCSGCQAVSACGDACINLPAGSEGNCAACQDCDGNGNCAFIPNGQQDVGCSEGATACSGADTCNGAGACSPNHLSAGAEGGCATCQDCDGNGNCAFVANGQQDLGCSAPAGMCSTPDVCNGSGSCGHRDTDRLTSEMGLWTNQSITSCDGRFTLVMQGDGNLVLYGLGRALWASNTVGTGANLALMQSDGNLVIYNPWSAVWTSNTWMHHGAWLIVQNDGNLVIYTSWGYPVWASNTVLRCGDNYCDAPENAYTCPQDCGYCGDGSCYAESCDWCWEDCGECPDYCGDGYCDRSSESCGSCPEDCPYCEVY